MGLSEVEVGLRVLTLRDSGLRPEGLREGGLEEVWPMMTMGGRESAIAIIAAVAGAGCCCGYSCRPDGVARPEGDRLGDACDERQARCKQAGE